MAKILMMPDPGIEDKRVVHLIESMEMVLISPANLTSFLVDETITRYIYRRRNGLDQFMLDSLRIDIRSQVLTHLNNHCYPGVDPDEFESLVNDEVETVMAIYPKLKELVECRMSLYGDMGDGDAFVNIVHGIGGYGNILIQMEDVNG